MDVSRPYALSEAEFAFLIVRIRKNNPRTYSLFIAPRQYATERRTVNGSFASFQSDPHAAILVGKQFRNEKSQRAGIAVVSWLT
jgi:hypothetical protein